MKLCELKSINKNTRYKLLIYNDCYYMIDLAESWLSYIFPMINWFVPKKCVQISKKEFEILDIAEPVKRKNIVWIIIAYVCLSNTLRKATFLLDFQAEKQIRLLICLFSFFAIVLFLKYIHKKIKLNIYKKERVYSSFILFPTLKSVLILLYFWGIFLLFSIITGWVLIIEDKQNIILLLCWILSTILFLCSNMVSFNDTKVRAKLITKEK